MSGFCPRTAANVARQPSTPGSRSDRMVLRSVVSFGPWFTLFPMVTKDALWDIFEGVG